MQGRRIEAVSKAIRRTRAGLKDPKRPAGSFIFLGPSGVGKSSVLKLIFGNYRCDKGSILIRDGVIAAIGPGLTTTGAVVEARGCVVTPGLVNTHHHLYQSLTRAVPGGQDALLFGWLKTLYPIWARFGPEELRLHASDALRQIRRR